MTDALSELVRMGLRNPVRVTVKVESKKLAGTKRKAEEVIEERRTPARYKLLSDSLSSDSPTVCKTIIQYAEQRRRLFDCLVLYDTSETDPAVNLLFILRHALLWTISIGYSQPYCSIPFNQSFAEFLASRRLSSNRVLLLAWPSSAGETDADASGVHQPPIDDV